MNRKIKTIRRIWEKIYPSAVSLLLLLGGFVLTRAGLIPPAALASVKEKILSPGFLDTLVTVESILLGFLLAVFALVLQSGSPAIDELKRANRFRELIAYNRNAVIHSFLTVVLTLLVTLLLEPLPACARSLLLYLWLFSTLTSLLSTFRFLDIFYALIKQ